LNDEIATTVPIKPEANSFFLPDFVEKNENPLEMSN
jgi:hypothetical protein